MFAGILASLTTLELSFSSSIPFVTIALSSSASIFFFFFYKLFLASTLNR